MKKYDAVLVVNLGSPDSPTIPSIQNYLKEFLSDPYVLKMPSFFRYLLVHGLILPFRPKKTVHAYQQIWTPAGAPLKVNTFRFAKKLSEKTQLPVEVAMRYGSPSIEEALKNLAAKKLFRLKVVLMYPQYALSTTLTAHKKLEQLNSQQHQNQFQFQFIQDFHSEEGFIQSVVEKVYEVQNQKTSTQPFPWQHLLISFHGLPWNHLGKAIQSSVCKNIQCCDTLSASNQKCYRAQCYSTARKIAAILNLKPSEWSIGFQSRLTRGWIEPFTDVITQELIQRGIKNIAVICPSFTADCLETLEEIQIREKEAFLKAGGKSLTYIPCVNDSDMFVNFVSHLIENKNPSQIPT